MSKLILSMEDFNIEKDGKTNEERLVRNSIVVPNKTEPLYIYEPTDEDYAEIKALMAENQNYQFNVEEIFNVLIYRFTNLDMTGLDEITRQKIVANPPLYLRKVLAEIKTIISEIVDSYFCDMKAQVSELRTMINMSEITKEINSIDMENLKNKMHKATNVIEKNKDKITDEEYAEMKRIASQFSL